jgi:hypothetical protein
MSEKDEKSGIKNWTVRMEDGSIRSFLAREKARFVDSNGGDMVALEVFDPYPYPAKAGCPTIPGRRRTRAAPAGMAPALSWS